jgi:Lysyl oxidase
VPRLLVLSAVAAALVGTIALSSAGADTSAAGGSAGRSLPGDVLPDLRVEPSRTVELAAAGGRRKLRFSTDVTNLGPGPLELVPRKEDCDRDGKSSNERTAYQSIRSEVSGFRHLRAGCMVFHADHGHWHFERFVSAQLRRAGDGRLVAARNKVSFCLEDSLRSARVPEALADEERFAGCASDATMGISAGWTDHYDPDLSGQSIDVGHVPPGLYRLVLRADPENRLVERNERNNHGAVALRLRRDGLRRVPTSSRGKRSARRSSRWRCMVVASFVPNRFCRVAGMELAHVRRGDRSALVDSSPSLKRSG